MTFFYVFLAIAATLAARSGWKRGARAFLLLVPVAGMPCTDCYDRMPVGPRQAVRAASVALLALAALLGGCFGEHAPVDTDAGETMVDAGPDAPPVCWPQAGNCNGLGCVDDLTADPNCGTCGNNCAAKGERCAVVGPDIYGCAPIPCTAKGDACMAGDCTGTCDGVTCDPTCPDAGQ